MMRSTHPLGATPLAARALNASFATALLLTTSLLGACGGDGDEAEATQGGGLFGPGPSGPAMPPTTPPPTTPPPTTPPSGSDNRAPVLSVSSSAPSTEENAVGPLATVAATDADGDTVTLSLQGPDAARFVVSNGELAFREAPDFEAPTDADGNNVYEFAVVADDGNAGTARESVSVSVSDLVPLPTFVEAATGFQQPTYAAELPQTGGKLLVLEKQGRLRLVDPGTGAINAEDFLSLSDISTNSERGVLGFAVAADYATSRQIYVHVSNSDGDTEIRRYTLAPNSTERADPASAQLVIRVAQPFSNHNAGWIGFDANGYLVVPLGDGGSGGDPQGNAQNTQSLLGKVLRLDVAGDDYPDDPLRNYAIPPGNTFADASDGRPEIFAVGLRNPFRSSFDPATGDLLIGDVGQNAREEINRLPMDDATRNFGWNIREGSIAFGDGGNPEGLTLPIVEYEHGAGPTQGMSVTGGVMFDGESDIFDDAYVFADFISQNIWTVPSGASGPGPVTGDDFGRVNDDLLLDSAQPNRIVSFSVSSDNRLYVTSIDGTVYRLEERE